jgi:hypothetical protein|tara:strand:- start:336 stop:1019 length:684 start_codon:yes stop_codon:yes gene_type:complete
MKVNIKYVSYPRTGTIWTELLIKSYFDKTGFNYDMKGHHDLWHIYPMKDVGETFALVGAANFSHLCIYNYRKNFKRVAFSNFYRITSSESGVASDPYDILFNIIDTYSQHLCLWFGIENSHKNVVKIQYESMLEHKEDYFINFLKSIGAKSKDINIEAIRKSFEENTREKVSQIHKKNQSKKSGNLVSYVEDNKYETKYNSFLNEYGDWIDDLWSKWKNTNRSGIDE